MVPTQATTRDAGFLPHLSRVAVDGDQVVGHVIATRTRLEPLGHPVLGLGPLGVHPHHQKHGVGTALMHELLAVAEAADERRVALLGSPDYYRRFGFRPAADLGITAPAPGSDPRGNGSFTHILARSTQVKLPLPGLSGGGPAAG